MHGLAKHHKYWVALSLTIPLLSGNPRFYHSLIPKHIHDILSELELIPVFPYPSMGAMAKCAHCSLAIQRALCAYAEKYWYKMLISAVKEAATRLHWDS